MAGRSHQRPMRADDTGVEGNVIGGGSRPVRGTCKARRVVGAVSGRLVRGRPDCAHVTAMRSRELGEHRIPPHSLEASGGALDVDEVDQQRFVGGRHGDAAEIRIRGDAGVGEKSRAAVRARDAFVSTAGDSPAMASAIITDSAAVARRPAPDSCIAVAPSLTAPSWRSPFRNRRDLLADLLGIAEISFYDVFSSKCRGGADVVGATDAETRGPGYEAGGSNISIADAIASCGP